MPTDNRSREELLSENERLRFRLEEAEETLQAIHSGEVDALVISSASGESQVFSLQGAEHPYRVLVETMSEGAAFLCMDGMIAYCNRRLADLLQVPMEKLISQQRR
jgi:PAS domain-containing protein